MAAKCVLYIEDNFQNRRLVKKILNAKGYEVIEAEEGLRGIDLAVSRRPDLILMDINMPGIDGMEVTKRLKESISLKRIPIIALTANAMRGDREKIMAAGCDDYMQKPINNARLVEMVERYIALNANAPANATGTGTMAAVAAPAAVAVPQPQPAVATMVTPAAPPSASQQMAALPVPPASSH